MPREPEDDAALRRIRAPLLRWYDRHRRDLPWRHTRDPYAIWISEAMLQQTRVETVIPYWERFLARFPTVEALAAAELDEVYGVWTGLGYYSRARNLRHAAQTVVTEHAGRLPDDAPTLRGLKGIGRYTAGAVASIAFDREEPLVDGNVTRVLTRLAGIREDSTRKDVVEALWSLAGELVRGKRPGDFNQALMELGATVCLPKAPRCDDCPLGRHCDAHAAGDASSLPRKPARRKARAMRGVAAWIERGGRILAVRRPEQGLMAGLWELPGAEIETAQEPKAVIEELLVRHVGLTTFGHVEVGEVEHLFTHRRLRLTLFRCHAERGERVRLDGFAAHRWLRPAALLELAHAGPTRKALHLLGVTDEHSARAAGRRAR